MIASDPDNVNADPGLANARKGSGDLASGITALDQTQVEYTMPDLWLSWHPRIVDANDGISEGRRP
jgi:hypothetical protein